MANITHVSAVFRTVLTVWVLLVDSTHKTLFCQVFLLSQGFLFFLSVSSVSKNPYLFSVRVFVGSEGLVTQPERRKDLHTHTQGYIAWMGYEVKNVTLSFQLGLIVFWRLFPQERCRPDVRKWQHLCRCPNADRAGVIKTNRSASLPWDFPFLFACLYKDFFFEKT